MNNVLMKAILAMDSYNRGYDQGVEITGSQIGRATITSDSIDLGTQEINGQTVRNDANISFYAIAYDYNGEKVISYRGTDDIISDAYHGWTLGAGNLDSKQGKMAIEFYKTVVGACPFNNDRDTYSC